MKRSKNALRRLVRLTVLALASLCVSVGLLYHGEAAAGKKAGKSSQAGGQQSLISRDRAASIARSATGGRVLNIQLNRGNRPKYSVKMLLDGKRVRTVGVDARTGAVSK